MKRFTQLIILVALSTLVSACAQTTGTSGASRVVDYSAASSVTAENVPLYKMGGY